MAEEVTTGEAEEKDTAGTTASFGESVAAGAEAAGAEAVSVSAVTASAASAASAAAAAAAAAASSTNQIARGEGGPDGLKIDD